ncbi:LysR family transcriptional regulator [Micromonospora sp. ZYX-F-536]|uniref:LysR family transcriptional regulator n=1 Tax=Micromonospora sp. ZYX-F-536 TaxID=3457629 RepID=UPI00404073FD
MDVVAACRAFVSVSGYGSFTAGAAAARIPQSVASRRIAALEEHLGDRLFDRSSRAVTLTPFGRDMLPSARRLVDLADAMKHDAERARLRPFRLAVPAICAARPLAHLVAEGRKHHLHLDLRKAGPAARRELCRTLDVRAAIVAVPAAEATWQVPLGLAGQTHPEPPTVFLDALRPGRARSTERRARIWIQPEDDVPHIRDPLTRLGQAVGLQPAQVAVAPSLVDAAATTLGSTDLLLCSPDQADELGLRWRPLSGTPLTRGYDIAAAVREDAHQLRSLLHGIGRCLGVPADDGRPA